MKLKDAALSQNPIDPTIWEVFNHGSQPVYVVISPEREANGRPAKIIASKNGVPVMPGTSTLIKATPGKKPILRRR